MPYEAGSVHIILDGPVIEIATRCGVMAAAIAPTANLAAIDPDSYTSVSPVSPDGADALMSMAEHSSVVPTKAPNFVLAATTTNDDGLLLRHGPPASVRP